MVGRSGRRSSPRSASTWTAISVEPLIVELDGRPIAYLQSYDPHLEDGHPYQDQPFGTLGIDLSIGVPDLVGIGHGSAIVRQFVDSCSRKARRASSSIPIRPMRGHPRL